MEAQRTVCVSAGAGVDLEKLHEKVDETAARAQFEICDKGSKNRTVWTALGRRGRKNGTRLQRQLGLANAKHAQNN